MQGKSNGVRWTAIRGGSKLVALIPLREGGVALRVRSNLHHSRRSALRRMAGEVAHGIGWPGDVASLDVKAAEVRLRGRDAMAGRD